jgi:tetratricopeptide (TPR) repeat protein
MQTVLCSIVGDEQENRACERISHMSRKKSTILKLVCGLAIVVIVSAVVSFQGIFSYRRGVSLSNNGMYAEAIPKLTKAIKGNPHSALAHYQRGFAYASIGSDDLAIEDYTAAITLNKNGILERYSLLNLCYYNRGVSYYTIDEIDKAIDDFTSALAIKDDFAEAYANRGKAYRDNGDKERALADLRKAIEVNPTYREKIGSLIEQLERSDSQ